MIRNLRFACILLLIHSICLAQDYTIEFEANGETLAVVKLVIEKDVATTTVDGVIERFDLSKQSWWHDGFNQWVTLAQCEAWAEESKQRSTNSAASIPKAIRPFVLWSLDPQFEIAETKTSLTLTSGQVDYDIVVEQTEADLTAFFRYARLNAFKKAMAEKKLPPFAELRVIDELEVRQLKPLSMKVEVPGIPEAPAMKITYHEEAP